MRTGRFIFLPMPGSLIEQPPDLIDAIRYSWRVWYVYRHKPANKKKWDGEDLEFMERVNDLIGEYDGNVEND